MDTTPDNEHDVADDPSAPTSAPASAPGSGPRTGRIERQLARRRQRERLIGILIAVLGIAVLVVAVIALRNPHHGATAAGTDTHQSTPQPAPSVPASGASAPASGSGSGPSSGTSTGTSSIVGSKPLIVLNQTTTPDLAAQAAQRFEHAGWRVSSTQEGYQNDVITTTAYYDPAIAGAKRAALALQRQFATIHRVAQRFPQLPAGPVVVVLTTDYAA
jgi:hypothetical protein